MRRKSTLSVVLIGALLAVVLVAGCGSSAEKGKEARPTVFVDDLGREVEIAEVPQSIVSIAPSCTEILFALGLGDKVIGVTEYCDYPEEAKEKPKIGTFTTPNLEAILSLEPDLVLATGGVQAEILGRMEELGLTVFAVNPMTFEQTVEDIRKIGEITGAVEEAEGIARDMEERAEAVAKRVRELEAEGKKRPRVFYEIYYENNVWTAGKSSIISDLISLAGGENIGDVEASDYYEFSVERLMAENPQVYLVGSGSMSNPGDVTRRPGWDRMEAVREGRVYVIDEDLVYRTGPRLIQGLEAIHRALFP
ncbi:ABC transporter substrate-binding protein [Candidatus Solincola sp.]|nr:cobalamin-binding protein [Actinomycetota bacterium]